MIIDRQFRAGPAALSTLAAAIAATEARLLFWDAVLKELPSQA